jgi:threonine synthase
VPHAVPSLPSNWTSWKDLSFHDLAYEIMSLYISSEEIDASSLKDIVKRSYSTFRDKNVTPLVPLDKEKNLYLLELFHGPTFAFVSSGISFQRHALRSADWYAEGCCTSVSRQPV